MTKSENKVEREPNEMMALSWHNKSVWEDSTVKDILYPRPSNTGL